MVFDVMEFELLISRSVSMIPQHRGQKGQKDELLALCMEIYPADCSFNLVEADVVEPFEARPRDSPHAMIRDEEVFFPPHEDVFSLGEIAVREVGSLSLFSQRAPGRKPRPVIHVSPLRCAPFFVTGLEGVFGSNDFSFEERRQGRVIFRKACRRVRVAELIGRYCPAYLVYGDSRRDRIQPYPRV